MSSIVQHVPRFSAEDAVRIAEELFGLVVTARQLPSKRDQNFLLAASNGRKFVLKLANSTERREMLEFQNQARGKSGTSPDLRFTNGDSFYDDMMQSSGGMPIR